MTTTSETGPILVGFDGSDAAKTALTWALHRAAAVEADVVVLYVADTSWDSPGYTAAPLLQERGEVMLANEAFRTDRAAPHVTVTPLTKKGEPVKVLCAEAEALGARLLVVGSYRKDLYDRLTTSAVSLRVAAAAKVPVVVIPDLPVEGRSGVVVGIDGSPSSVRLVEVAAAEASRLGETLRVISAWTLPPLAEPDFTDLPDLTDALEDRAHRVIADTLAEAGVVGEREDDGGRLEIRTETPLEPPAAALIEAARSASLLVVGSHGRHGIGRFLLGSVSHDVLIHAPGPTLVLRVTDKA